LKTLALVPVPGSLTSLFGGGGATVGAGLALKAAAAVTAGLVIGGAGYEGVRYAPWHAQKPAAAVPQRSVAPGGAVVAPRKPSRLTGAAIPRSHPTVANAKPKKANKLKTHGRGNGASSAGGASVAAGHVKVAHQLHQASPARGAAGHKKARQKPKSHQLPGPIGKGPPAGHGKQK
jgi:hypothetical protein